MPPSNKHCIDKSKNLISTVSLFWVNTVMQILTCSYLSSSFLQIAYRHLKSCTINIQLHTCVLQLYVSYIRYVIRWLTPQLVNLVLINIANLHSSDQFAEQYTSITEFMCLLTKNNYNNYSICSVKFLKFKWMVCTWFVNTWLLPELIMH